MIAIESPKISANGIPLDQVIWTGSLPVQLQIWLKINRNRKLTPNPIKPPTKKPISARSSICLSILKPVGLETCTLLPEIRHTSLYHPTTPRPRENLAQAPAAIRSAAWSCRSQPGQRSAPVPRAARPPAAPLGAGAAPGSGGQEGRRIW